MTVNNPDNLRTQFIEPLDKYLSEFPSAHGHEVFDECLWPILQAAMKAGELLVARNTGPQIPVAQAILGWLEGVITVVNRVREDEKIISKAKLLKILYDLEQIGQRALTDARALPF